jgi:hypothetical protein
LQPDAEIGSEESWRTVLPGSFEGATRVDDLWHLYYREKPPFSVGDTFEIAPSGHTVENQAKRHNF